MQLNHRETADQAQREARPAERERKMRSPQGATAPLPRPGATGPLPQPGVTGPLPRRVSPQPPRHARTQATAPLPRPELEYPEEKTVVTKESKLRQVFLILLPVFAVILTAVLVFLIYRMPDSSDVKLKPRETPPTTDVLLQTTPPATALMTTKASTQSTTLEPVKIRSERMSSLKISRLIQAGAGVSPGENQGVPELLYKQGDTVPTWPGIAAAVSEETTPPAELPDPYGTDAPPVQMTDYAEITLPPETTAPVTEMIQTTPLQTNPPVTVESTEIPVPPSTTLGDTVDLLPTQPQEQPVDPAVMTIPTEQALEPLDPNAIPLPETTGPEMPVPPIEFQAGGFIPSGMTAYIYGNIVNMRSDADMNSEILREVYAGEVVEEIETNGSWSRVRLQDGMEGYIYSNLLSYNYVPPELPEVPMPEEDTIVASDFVPYYGTLYASNSSVNIRSGPSLNSEVISTMYYGDWVTATGYVGGWFQIEWYNGEVAYVNGDYLQEDPISQEELTGEIVHEDVAVIAAPPPVDQSTLAGGGAVVNLAMQYVGYPYVYGASGPNAFDCSGFTSYIFGSLGFPITRTTYTQVNDGIPVPFTYRDYSNLVPGDLLLFGEGSNVFHAGIYIGGGQMVHAGTEATGVIIDDLNLEFWASRLAYVRRIIY